MDRVANLGQRAGLIGVAFVIWAGAWGLGQLALRLISPPLEFVGEDKGGLATHGLTLERTFFAMALGLSAVPLLTLGLGLAGLLNRWIFIAIFVAAIAAEVGLRIRPKSKVPIPKSENRKAGEARRPWPLGVGPWALSAIAVVVPFLIVMWLGSMTPEADFDVGTYHFEGPKEYFQNGRITFLPHNFYTNFPFLTEMFALLGMVLRGDWYWGAIAGKCALFGCAPLTALGLFAAGRRWYSVPAGLLAVVVYLTTPWIDRVSIIALAEGGMTYFLFATLFAALMAVERLQAGQSREPLDLHHRPACRQRHGMQIHRVDAGRDSRGDWARCHGLDLPANYASRVQRPKSKVGRRGAADFPKRTLDSGPSDLGQKRLRSSPPESRSLSVLGC